MLYERANKIITNQGLSLGARLLLGLVAGLFGAVMCNDPMNFCSGVTDKTTGGGSALATQ
jgi:hypothetical protein